MGFSLWLILVFSATAGDRQFFDEDIPGLRYEDTREDFLAYQQLDREDEDWSILVHEDPVPYEPEPEE
jgi:hypothetical protein